MSKVLDFLMSPGITFNYEYEEKDDEEESNIKYIKEQNKQLLLQNKQLKFIINEMRKQLPRKKVIEIGNR